MPSKLRAAFSSSAYAGQLDPRASAWRPPPAVPAVSLYSVPCSAKIPPLPPFSPYEPYQVRILTVLVLLLLKDFQVHLISGVFVTRDMSVKIAQVSMHRWTLTHSVGGLSVHDFPHLDALFDTSQAIYRWMYSKFLIFSNSSQAFFLPAIAIPNSQETAARQLTRPELDHPSEHFSDALLVIESVWNARHPPLVNSQPSLPPHGSIQRILLDAIVVSRTGYNISPVPVDVHHSGPSRAVPILDQFGYRTVQRSALKGATGTPFVAFFVSSPSKRMEVIVLFRRVPCRAHQHGMADNTWGLRSVEYVDVADARQFYCKIFWCAPRDGQIGTDEEPPDTASYKVSY
ncbi:hypothetical protein HWV62_39786 [Athelia sp. TMB]|nr:hypothetical protein HWV62_39786 [Athelia sp. TMB]